MVSEEKFFNTVITSSECWNCGRRISNRYKDCPGCEIKNDEYKSLAFSISRNKDGGELNFEKAREDRDKVKQILKTLPPRQRQAAELFYGINGPEHTYEQMDRAMNIKGAGTYIKILKKKIKNEDTKLIRKNNRNIR